MCYLIFKEGEKLNTLILAVASLLISVLKAKIDTLNETIYEVSFSCMFNRQIDRPHRCAAYIAQILRLMLFGASQLSEDQDASVSALPEVRPSSRSDT